MERLSEYELDNLAARIQALELEEDRLRSVLLDQVTLYGFKSRVMRGRLYEYFAVHGNLVIRDRELEVV